MATPEEAQLRDKVYLETIISEDLTCLNEARHARELALGRGAIEAANTQKSLVEAFEADMNDRLQEYQDLLRAA